MRLNLSKDYKTLKILPNELPQDPDIEKVKKEEYVFKKDDDLITPIDASIETNEIDSILPTDSMATASNTSEPFMEIISSISNEIGKNLDPTGTTEGVQIMIIERKDLEKTVTVKHQAPSELNILNTTDDKTDLRATEDATVFSTNEIDVHSDKENYLNLSNGGAIHGSIFETFHFDDSDEKSDSDDSDEDYATDIAKPTRPTEYYSRQRSMPSSTLLHGFITNPGYPSFYIGKNSDCKWKLNLNEGEKIALTILDLHLRSEKIKRNQVKLYLINSSAFQSTTFAKIHSRLLTLQTEKLCTADVLN